MYRRVAPAAVQLWTITCSHHNLKITLSATPVSWSKAVWKLAIIWWTEASFLQKLIKVTRNTQLPNAKLSLVVTWQKTWAFSAKIEVLLLQFPFFLLPKIRCRRTAGCQRRSSTAECSSGQFRRSSRPGRAVDPNDRANHRLVSDHRPRLQFGRPDAGRRKQAAEVLRERRVLLREASGLPNDQHTEERSILQVFQPEMHEFLPNSTRIEAKLSAGPEKSGQHRLILHRR